MKLVCTALCAVSLAVGSTVAVAENFIFGERGIKLPDAMAGLPIPRDTPRVKLADLPGGELHWSPWAGRFIIPFHTAPRPHPRKAEAPTPERPKRDLAEQK